VRAQPCSATGASATTGVDGSTLQRNIYKFVEQGSVFYADTQSFLGAALRVNIFGVLHGIRSLVPRLLAGGEDHVVNTASFSGLVNLFLSPPYSTSKAAVVALSESLHFQLRALGPPVGVSVLCPSWVRTRIVESDRNRPRHLPQAPSSPRTEGARSALREVVASGMGPGEVADHVVRAIRANRFYVLPHHDEDHLALVRQRTTDIIEEGSPALPTIPGIGPVPAALAGPAETR
jgi:short-subunit dehydrogenase